MASQKASKGIPGSASNKNRQANYLRYANDQRAEKAKLDRLIALCVRADQRHKSSLWTKYHNDLLRVYSAMPINIRTEYKSSI